MRHHELRGEWPPKQHLVECRRRIALGDVAIALVPADPDPQVAHAVTAGSEVARVAVHAHGLLVPLDGVRAVLDAGDVELGITVARRGAAAGNEPGVGGARHRHDQSDVPMHPDRRTSV